MDYPSWSKDHEPQGELHSRLNAYLQIWKLTTGREKFRYINLKQKLYERITAYIDSYELLNRLNIEKYIHSIYLVGQPQVFEPLVLGTDEGLISSLLDHKKYRNLIRDTLHNKLIEAFEGRKVGNVMKVIYEIDAIRIAVPKSMNLQIVFEVVDFESAVSYYIKQTLSDEVFLSPPSELPASHKLKVPPAYSDLALMLYENEKPNVIECLKKSVSGTDFIASFKNLSEIIVIGRLNANPPVSLESNYVTWFEWMSTAVIPIFISPSILQGMNLPLYEVYLAKIEKSHGIEIKNKLDINFTKYRADLCNYELLVKRVKDEDNPYHNLRNTLGDTP